MVKSLDPEAWIKEKVFALRLLKNNLSPDIFPEFRVIPVLKVLSVKEKSYKFNSNPELRINWL